MKRSLLLGCLLAASLLRAAPALLSDNNYPNHDSAAFPGDTPRIATGATVSWVTDGPFPTDRGLITIGNNQLLTLIDGRIGPEGASQAYGSWGQPDYYGTFIIDLKQPFLIEATRVWAQERDTMGMGQYEVLLSCDGIHFTSVGSAVSDTKARSTDEKGIPLSFTLEKPAAARYVQFRVKKRVGAFQLVLSEAAVFGRRLNEGEAEQFSPEKQRPGVKFSVTGIQEGAVILDWSDFARRVSEVKEWLVYSDHSGREELIVSLPAAETRKLIFPLEPEHDYRFGVAARTADGSTVPVEWKQYRTPRPLECRTFGDMLAVNFYWGGSSEGTVADRPEHIAWNTVAVQLLSRTPFRQIRWWRCSPDIVKKYYDVGVGILSFPHEQAFKDGKAVGSYAYTAGNEPHLWGKPVQAYLDVLKEHYEMAKKYDPRNVITAPTTGLENHALKYLEEFYAAGGKAYFDVLDLHTYTGNSADFHTPEGYPGGVPEQLFERIARVREIMAKYGDADKPMISTEYGYSDCNVANPLGYSVTREQVAEMITRGLLIHYVLGFKRVFLYSYWDAGNDPNYTEHAFGMLDWDLQKKPSFYAVATLGRELGSCTLSGPMKGVDNELIYGYVFRESDKEEHVSVIWDGRGSYSGTFRTAPGKVEVIRMKGEREVLHTSADGTFRTIYGSGPIYLRSAQPVELLKSLKVEKNSDAGESVVILTPGKTVVVIPPGEKQTTARFLLKNSGSEPLRAEAVLENGRGEKLAARSLELPAGKETTLTFPVEAGEDILEPLRLTVTCDGKYSSSAVDCDFFVRRLQPNTGKTELKTATIAGGDAPVWVLSDDTLELTVDPKRGGRILEIYDKRTGANQLNLDYSRINHLESVNNYYCIWDEVRDADGRPVDRSAPYRAEAVEGKLRLTSPQEAPVELIKELSLTGNGGFRLNVTVTNRDGKPRELSYYMHPEYTVGGSGDHGIDKLVMPIQGEEITMPFWTGLGEKPTGAFTSGWWRVEDTAARYSLTQRFSLNEFRTPRIWFGIGCYNLEMQSPEGLTLNPGESWNGTLEWQFESAPAK